MVESQTTSRELSRRNRELSILNTIADNLNREVDLQKALNTTLSLVVDLFALKTGWVWMFTEDTETSYLASSQNLPPALRDNPAKMDGSCTCISSFMAGDMEGAANVNAIKCSRLSELDEGTDGLLYHSSVPLYAHGKKLGILNVVSEDWQEISKDDLQLLHTIGDLLGIAIERARLFSDSMESGALEERSRLAREMHDTLAQGLTAITLQLESIDALITSPDNLAETQGIVKDTLHLARQSLEEARRSIMDLRAVPLEGRSLPEALSALVQSHALNVSSKIDFSCAGASTPLPTRIEVGLYRIAQEALLNAVTHSQADLIQVRLVLSPEEAYLTVEDNGRGFDSQADQGERFGLVGLNERVKLLGGTLDLQTTLKEGTRLQVQVGWNS